MGQSEDTETYVSFDRIFEDAREEQGAMPLKKIQDYVDRLAAGKEESENGRGHAFFNGRHLPLNDVSICSLSLWCIDLVSQDFLRALQAESTQQLQWLQEKVSFLSLVHELDPCWLL